MPEDRESTTVEQDTGAAAVAPVPAPGSPDSSAGAGLLAAQGAAAGDDVAEGEPSGGGSPGAWTAVAARGKPDGEVDTSGGGAG